ncbi:unnamed protein product [Caenorhabditis auriculariae]|uniref:glucuronosyltransferase n=1 Tax=Caenorhabditis auriculariae TaxID=2777116 RepID=A0A8S1H2B8_9PELO|nr:unnamed protein product [Caenorhabditis auriculariae]
MNGAPWTNVTDRPQIGGDEAGEQAGWNNSATSNASGGISEKRLPAGGPSSSHLYFLQPVFSHTRQAFKIPLLIALLCVSHPVGDGTTGSVLSSDAIQASLIHPTTGSLLFWRFGGRRIVSEMPRPVAKFAFSHRQADWQSAYEIARELMFLPTFILALVLHTSKALHHNLNSQELKQVFGVNNKHEVPEYSLIDAKRVRNKNGDLKIRFSAWNDTYHLHLKKNSRIVSPHVVTVIRQGDNVTQFNGLQNYRHCHYQGKVKSHGDRAAAVSDCGSLMGSLIMEDHFLVLQTVPNRVRHLQKEQHLVFKRAAGLLSDTESRIREEISRLQESQESFCDTSESLDDPTSSQSLQFNYTVPASGQLDSPFIFPNMDPITLEIGLFLDSKLFEHFQREYIQDAEQHLLEFSLALINNVHVLYQQDTLTPNLDIVIVRYEMWKSQPSALGTLVHRNGQAQSLLDAFCRYQAHMNPGTDLTDMQHWDHGVLLTGYDIYHTTTSVAGVAPVARMCDPLFACSLVEGLHLGRSFVLAHEMGHNMGMVHDGVQNQCSKSCCLMSAVNGAGKTTWSECSVREFNAFLLQLDESGRGNCLRDASPGLLTTNHLSDTRLPGQRFTADQQCSYFWGREYKVEIPNGRSMDDICRILWCGNSGSTISTAHPALEGSWCGDEKWCHKGHCMSWQFGDQPLPIDGSWSEWGGAEKSCPIQQCQVTGSIVVQPQHRDCVNPAPNNGGQTCRGASIRGIVCGSTISSCQGYSREEFGNKVCSSIKYDPHKPDHQLTGEGFEHSTQPCRVWCHLIDSELIRNKGQFPDGTPCGDGSFCVGGQCLGLSCDSKGLVELEEDCPRLDERSTFEWQEWSNWSECSISCGIGGRQIRKRECSLPQKCKGKFEDSRECLGIPLECEEYGTWQEWSKCTKKCGFGVQVRYRQCLSGNCEQSLLEQTRPCDNEGCWASWQEWSDCSRTCGGGRRYRVRKCLDDKCDEDSVEKQLCNSEKCVEQTWGDWLPCSVSCGIGFQIRERLCDGQLCPTANKQARTCNQQQCPVVTSVVIWNEWTEWSTCTETCGEGVQTRERTCRRGNCDDADSTMQRRCVNGPCEVLIRWSEWSSCASCSSFESRSRSSLCDDDQPECQKKSEEESCDNVCLRERFISKPRLITGVDLRKAFGKPNLPIEKIKNKAEWSGWSPCSVTCGTGMRFRSLMCPEGNCQNAADRQEEECSNNSCLELFVWSDWSSCSVSCGLGIRTRRKLCLFNGPQCAAEVEHVRCDSMPDCTNNVSRFSFATPRWSEWSSWSACSCFSLTSTRRRFCQVNDPAIQGFCAGPILEQIPCVPISCSPSAGSWSGWSEWSLCSRDCAGTGHQIRNRMCSEPIPSNRGAYCSGYSFDQRACVMNMACGKRVDGGWTEWTDWSECTDHCRNGHKSRTRFCANPRPSEGGNPCLGSDFELQPCFDPSRCHSKEGAWGAWSAWSECSAECGFGVQSRERTCSSPKPSGGDSCVGVAHQTSLCQLPACDHENDGEWSAWNEWSHCMGNCGFGTRTRLRACVSPPTSGGGQPCFGRSSESVECLSPAIFCSPFILYCPSISKSHVLLCAKYADALHIGGHQVVFFIPSYTSALDNYSPAKHAETIRVTNISDAFDNALSESEWTKVLASHDLGILKKIYFDSQCWVKMCEDVLIHRHRLDFLRDYNFDLAFVEDIDFCNFGVLEYLGIRNTVLLSSEALMDYIAYDNGIPSPISYVPSMEENALSDQMSFLERLKNTWKYTSANIAFRAVSDRIHKVFQKHIEPDFPHVSDLVRKTSFNFVNTNEMLDFPRPISHKFVFVGLLGANKTFEISPELDEILNKSEKGSIYISFGTVGPFHLMPDNVRMAIYNTIVKLREYQFLLKTAPGDKTTKLLFKNVRNVELLEWAPQIAVLKHKNVKLFVSHGGMNSVLEGMTFGTPMMVIPIFTDQFRNAKTVERRGSGKMVLRQDVTNTSFFDVINTILEDQKYSNNAARLSKLMLSRPFSAEERLLYWTDFVLKHSPRTFETRAGRFFSGRRDDGPAGAVTHCSDVTSYFFRMLPTTAAGHSSTLASSSLCNFSPMDRQQLPSKSASYASKVSRSFLRARPMVTKLHDLNNLDDFPPLDPKSTLEALLQWTVKLSQQSHGTVEMMWMRKEIPEARSKRLKTTAKSSFYEKEPEKFEKKVVFNRTQKTIPNKKDNERLSIGFHKAQDSGTTEKKSRGVDAIGHAKAGNESVQDSVHK